MQKGRFFFYVFTFCAGLTLLALGIISAYTTKQALDETAWIAHGQEVRQSISSVSAILSNAETGQRGYLLTGQPTYLEPYHLANAQANARISQLRELTRNNATQQISLTRLEPIVAARFRDLDDTLTVYKTKGRTGVEDALSDGQGRVLMERIRTILREMDAEESRLLGERIVEANRTVAIARWLVVALLLSTVPILIFSAMLVRRDMIVQEEQATRLRTMVGRDPLTGLLNRRELERRIELLAQQQTTDPTPATLMLIDIDHFKSVNDIYGHMTGDQVLSWVAVMLKGQLDGDDVLGRWSGEVFAVLLSNTAGLEAAAMAERLRATLMTEPCPITHVDGAVSLLPITASFGVIPFAPHLSANDVIARADSALYQAQAEGRNRVIAH